MMMGNKMDKIDVWMGKKKDIVNNKGSHHNSGEIILTLKLNIKGL